MKTNKFFIPLYGVTCYFARWCLARVILRTVIILAYKISLQTETRREFCVGHDLQKEIGHPWDFRNRTIVRKSSERNNCSEYYILIYNYYIYIYFVFKYIFLFFFLYKTIIQIFDPSYGYLIYLPEIIIIIIIILFFYY